MRVTRRSGWKSPSRPTAPSRLICGYSQSLADRQFSAYCIQRAEVVELLKPQFYGQRLYECRRSKLVIQNASGLQRSMRQCVADSKVYSAQ